MSSYPFLIARSIATGVVLQRLWAGRNRPRPIQSRPSLGDGPAVTVVIPARNEARRIGKCLEALGSNSNVFEVIVVDDESTDETAEVAKQLGARVVTGAPLPEGWVGKPWALQQGLDEVTTPYVIFIDADTRPKPGFVNAAVHEFVSNEFDIVSLATRFECNSNPQSLMQASFLAGLVYRFGAPQSIDQRSPERVLANGQCVITRAGWLKDQGGYSLAARYMTDDIALFRALRARGARVGFLDGSEIIEANMYESTLELWKQWPRSLSMAGVSGRTMTVFDLTVLWLTMALPIPRLILRRGDGLDVILVAVRTLLSLALTASFKKHRRAVALSAFGDLAAVARLTQATLVPARRWRGRVYGRRGTAIR